MSLTVTAEVILATSHEKLANSRDLGSRMRGSDREITIETVRMDDEALRDLLAAANKVHDGKTARAVDAILQARQGKFDKSVPNFKAFSGMLEAFLGADRIDGWIYVTGDDGKLYPHLVTSINYDDGRSHHGPSSPSVIIKAASYGLSSQGDSVGVSESGHVFYPKDVAKQRLTDILLEAGIYKETTLLREDYLASLERHHNVTQNAFSKQFRVDGVPFRFADDHYRRRGQKVSARVIHDLESKDYRPAKRYAESCLFDGADGGMGQIPEHPIIKVFDLRSHDFLWVHADNMTPYEYDKSLRDKLVLPKTHRDLLDVLTTDLGAFVSDFVEGKSAGNVILCKGIPGVGKTLTSEVYAELIERPLYSIHSGELGTTTKEIEKRLKTIFQRGKRWDCVLLLDEADVFVVQRGNNIEQNAIVAEFLRALEYFDGLLFMTTNRPDEIDEAIISRCAAIIDYAPPSPDDATAIWGVMARQYNTSLSDELVQQLVWLFPSIAPRDIKMLFRLALRVSASQKEPVSLETFRRCAMFRAIKIRDEVATGAESS